MFNVSGAGRGVEVHFWELKPDVRCLSHKAFCFSSACFPPRKIKEAVES